MPAGPDRPLGARTGHHERDVGIQDRLTALSVLQQDRDVGRARDERIRLREDRHAKGSGVLLRTEAASVSRRDAAAGEEERREPEPCGPQCSIPRIAIGCRRIHAPAAQAAASRSASGANNLSRRSRASSPARRQPA